MSVQDWLAQSEESLSNNLHRVCSIPSTDHLFRNLTKVKIQCYEMLQHNYKKKKRFDINILVNCKFGMKKIIFFCKLYNIMQFAFLPFIACKNNEFFSLDLSLIMF